MDRERARNRLSGCYVTVPTMFRDEDLSGRAIDAKSVLSRFINPISSSGTICGVCVCFIDNSHEIYCDFSILTIDYLVSR